MSEELKQRWEDCKRSAQIHGPSMTWDEFLSAHPWAWPMWNDAYRSNTSRAIPPSPSTASEVWELPSRTQINEWMRDAGWQNGGIRQADLDKVEKVVRAALAAKTAQPSTGEVDVEAEFRAYATSSSCRSLPAGLEWNDPLVEAAREAWLAARRIQAEGAKDAERFQWMLANIRTGSIGFGDWWIGAGDDLSEWRKAIDAAIAATQSKEAKDHYSIDGCKFKVSVITYSSVPDK